MSFPHPLEFLAAGFPVVAPPVPLFSRRHSSSNPVAETANVPCPFSPGSHYFHLPCGLPFSLKRSSSLVCLARRSCSMMNYDTSAPLLPLFFELIPRRETRSLFFSRQSFLGCRYECTFPSLLFFLRAYEQARVASSPGSLTSPVPPVILYGTRSRYSQFLWSSLSSRGLRSYTLADVSRRARTKIRLSPLSFKNKSRPVADFPPVFSSYLL